MKKKRDKKHFNWFAFVGIFIIGLVIGGGAYSILGSEEISVETCSDLITEEVFEGQEFECTVLESTEESNSSIAAAPSVKVGKRCKLHISKGVKLTCSF